MNHAAFDQSPNQYLYHRPMTRNIQGRAAGCSFRNAASFRNAPQVAVVMLALLCMPVLADPTVEDAERQLADSHAKIQSGTAKTKTIQDFILQSGQRIQSESLAEVAWMRKGSTILYRSDVTATQTQAGGGEIEMKSTGRWRSVHDGEFFYTVTEQHGKTSAAKYKPDPAQFGEPSAVFANLRKHFKLERMPDAKLDGFDCIVIELTPLIPETSPTTHTTAYFRKDTGLNIQNVSHDKDGRQAFISTTYDIEINVPVPVERFKFEPPPGVEVEDKTLNQSD